MELPLPLANLPPNYFLGKLIIFAQPVTLAHQAMTSWKSVQKYLIFVHFQEFVELMIKREAEKETQEDLKQVFRVFDKDGNGFVSTSEIKFVLSK